MILLPLDSALVKRGVRVPQAFFMTAKALHLGFVHMIEDHKELSRMVQRRKDHVASLQQMVDG